jgi:hypothetical protein
MSWVDKKQEIVDALNTVPAVKPHLKRPSAPRAGDAYPRIGNGDGSSGWFIAEHEVWVFLPTDESAADEWIDENVFDLIEALHVNGVGRVIRWSRANIANLPDKFQYGLVIYLRSA